jgi:hypothetical protein
MQQISTQIGEVLKDFRSAVEKASQEPRTYAKQSTYNYKPEQARFKLVIWFNDGNRRTFYSYDNIYFQKVPHLDEQQAFIKLIRLINKHAGQFKNAQIFATIDPERQKSSNYNYLVYWAKWNGTAVPNPALTFTVKEKDCQVILNKLEVYSSKEFVK